MAVEHGYGKIVTDGLVLCLDAADRNSYPGSGNTWYDLSGQGNNVSLLNGASVQDVNTNTVNIGFDGTNDYAYKANTNNLPSGTGTILTWVYISSSNSAELYSGLVGYGNRTNNTPSNSSLLSIDTRSSTWYVSSAYWYNDYISTSLSVNKNAWNFVGKIQRAQTTIDNTTLICNTNFDTGTSSNYTKNLNIANKNLTIGAADTNNSNRRINGNIPIVLIYNRELTQQEIQQNYNATKTRFGL